MNIRVSTRGRIVIPAPLRRRLEIKVGTRIVVEEDETSGHIVLRPITRKYIHSLRGKYKGRGVLKALMQEKGDERLAIYRSSR